MVIYYTCATNKIYYTCAINMGGRTIGMWTIGMEDNWHAENWLERQLALNF